MIKLFLSFSDNLLQDVNITSEKKCLYFLDIAQNAQKMLNFGLGCSSLLIQSLG